MSNSIRRSAPPPWVAASTFALGLASCLLAPPPAVAQERAVLEGVVVEEESFRAIASASVTLVGSRIETRSGADGVFTFGETPLGRVLVRVKAAGYPAIVEEVEVTPGSVFVPIFLPSAAAVLDELLVTATRAGASQNPQAQTAADLLSIHIPELRPGATYVQRRAAPARLGIRGRGTFNGDGQPTIVLDGARLNGGIEALRQIPAAQVKSIRILKGPTAGFLYGSPDGVIYIQTESGPPAP
ncbi:MAG: hypothetical protein EXR95_01400 [Gemmatimonadetes bacterium]|nr:hypothetical protein [Gemmatimonadota bacterium]